MNEFRKSSHKLKSGTHLFKGSQFVLEQIDNKIHIQRIVWAGGMQPELLRIGRQSAITNIVAALLGTNTADHLINQLHPKYTNDQVNYAWHQDIEHREKFDSDWQDVNGRGSFVQVLTAIDPMTIDNGRLLYVKYDKIKHHKNLKLKSIADVATVVDVKQAQPFLSEPGDTLFIGPYLIHGSEANKS